MSEYRRWISYIYNYDKGIKSTNAGYVRIESRNGKCRMTVNIKGGIAMGERLKMYLFYRRDSDMVMVYTGEGDFYNGICEYSVQTNVDDVFGSGMTIDQMGGVIAYSTMDRFYGTEWDDKPIVLRRIILHDVYVEEGRSTSIVDIDGEPVRIENKNEEMSIDYINDGNNDEYGRGENDNIDMNTEDVLIDDLLEKKDNSVSFIEDEEEYEEQQFGQEEYEQEYDDVDNDTDDLYIQPMSQSLSRIFSKMPGMYPFEDDDIMECVKFEPQDIGVFPMEKWQLASNSFLLHGYYTYRHLIFARRRTKNGPMCMLGVPGMFRDREKFMAKMFGFDKFKGIRGKKVPGYGEFGYWYMDIDMK